MSGTPHPDVRLRDLLLRARAVDPAVLAQAEQMAAATGTTLVQVLVHFRVVDPKRIVRLLNRGSGFDVVDVNVVEIHPRLLDLIPRHAAERLRVLPLSIARDPLGERLVLAMSDPTDGASRSLVEQATRLRVDLLLCDDADLQANLDRIYAGAVPVDAVVVGAVDPGAGFLTESTTEALKYVKGVVRSAEFPDLAPVPDSVPDSVAAHLKDVVEVVDDDSILPNDEDDTLEAAQRPHATANAALAAALAEVTSENARTPRTLPTMQEVWGAVTQAPTLTREPVDDGFAERTDEAARNRGLQTQTSRVIVVLPPGLSPAAAHALRGELLDAIGPIDVDDDPVRAARSAAVSRALILLGPRQQSALLRALLDLEERKDRPAIVILGGDPALSMLSFVSHHGELPAAPRAIAIAVLAALRQLGR